MKTIAEKILSAKSGRDAHGGDVVVCDVDWVIGTDASAPMAIDYFEQMGGTAVFDPARVVFALDHYASGAAADRFHGRVRDFAARTGAHVFEAGEGISHQIMVERGLVRPGQLIVGADSHTVTCGALNLFATGVGSSELAAAMLTGQLWFRVPESIRVRLVGDRPAGVSAKDIALSLVGEVGGDGANYQAVEFDGPALAALSLEDRLVVSNLAVEMGAKAAMFPYDARTTEYLDARNPLSRTDTPVASDADARYVREMRVDLGSLSPRIAKPHQPDHVVPLSLVAGTPVHMVFIGTCTGGRVVDFHEALDALVRGGGRIAPGVQLVLTPASREIEAQLRADGTLGRFEAKGAIVTTPGCGACCGTSGVIPSDGMTVLSTANRNFKARMGNPTASIYLASPAACGMAAAKGLIQDPTSNFELRTSNFKG
jgi:3-isopropylmalate/(R)-2-methylmalate dehydratase large subunit